MPFINSLKSHLILLKYPFYFNFHLNLFHSLLQKFLPLHFKELTLYSRFLTTGKGNYISFFLQDRQRLPEQKVGFQQALETLRGHCTKRKIHSFSSARSMPSISLQRSLYHLRSTVSVILQNCQKYTCFNEENSSRQVHFLHSSSPFSSFSFVKLRLETLILQSVLSYAEFPLKLMRFIKSGLCGQ